MRTYYDVIKRDIARPDQSDSFELGDSTVARPEEPVCSGSKLFSVN